MDPLDVFLGANLYQKLLFLAILAAVRPHFKATPQPKFCKNRFWATLYQKLPISAVLGAVSPHFKSDNSEIWREGMDLGHHPRP